MAATPPVLEMSLTNRREELPRLARAVEALAMRAGLSSIVLHRLNLVLEEILANTLAHGYPDGGDHRLEVRVSILANDIEAEIRDDARPFDPLADRPPPYLGTDLERRPTGGLGLYLARRFVREGRYETVGGNNRLIMKLDKKVVNAEANALPAHKGS